MKTSINKLSIIIPCFNEGRYIGNLLNELLIEVDPYEIIVIDDFSSDNSVDIIKNIQDKRISLFKIKKIMERGIQLFKVLMKLREK